MSRKILVLPLVLALGACATSSGQSPPGSGQPTPLVGPAAAHTQPGPSSAGWALAVVGTPFALVFKSAFCLASLAIAAPIAGLLTLDPDPYSEGHEILGDGIANNCGPPYVISPYAAG